MNDGVKILLDRMVTHPEEFIDELSVQGSKWSGLLNYYNNVLTLEEKKAIEQGLLKIKRNAFTQQVMERLLEEPTPVEIDPNTHTINRMGRAPWGTGVTTEQLEKLKLTMQKEAEKIRAEHPFKPFCGEVK